MKLRRRDLNILLVILVISLGGVAAWIFRLPHLVLYKSEQIPASGMDYSPAETDSALLTDTQEAFMKDSDFRSAEETDMKISSALASQPKNDGSAASSRFEESDLRGMIDRHPFSAEARKIIEGNLDETDSLSRHQILDYCEHLRKSYVTKDLDFLKQFYSDDALIIVGHVVKKGESSGAKIGYGDKVNYSIHSKKTYLERIARIFASNKAIRIAFSDFKILRHPTIEGIYGVTLRQKYKSDSYSDDGYLFLLWDFRNPALPQIHVRTWQPQSSISRDEERIDISDFNLE